MSFGVTYLGSIAGLLENPPEAEEGSLYYCTVANKQYVKSVGNWLEITAIEEPIIEVYLENGSIIYVQSE